MSIVKGYPTQRKLDRLSGQFATVEPVRLQQQGMSVVGHMFVREVGTDAVEASSSASVINATAHAAQEGDIIRFTSGSFSGMEVKVFATATNTITLAQDLSAAPGTGDTFQILRHKYPVVAADGTIGVSSSEQAVAADGGALPAVVKVIGGYDGTNVQVLSTDSSGVLNTNATFSGAVDQGNAGSAAQGWFAKITDGTDTALVSAAGALSVDGSAVTQPVSAASLPLPTGAATSAAQATGNASLSSIDGKLNSLGQKAMAASVPVVLASDQSNVNVVVASALPSGTNNIGDVDVLTEPATAADNAVGLPAVVKVVAGYDGANVQAIKTDAAGELQVDVLSMPAITATDLDIRDLTSVSDSVSAVQSGTWNINNVSGTVSLPTGAATSANQTNKAQFTRLTDGTDDALVTAAGELNVLASAQPGVDIGDVTINNASGAAAVNIQDGGNSITIDGSVALLTGSNNIGDVDVLTEPATAADGAASLPAVVKVIAGWDGTNVQALSTDASGVLNTNATFSGAVDQGNAGSAAQAWFAKITDGTDVALVSAAGALLVDGSAVTQPISAAALPLPSGAATSANQTNKSQFTHITDGTDDVLVTAAGELNVLASAQPGVDIGDVTINNASGASAVNIQDGGNSITVDGTVAATQSGTWNINNISGTVSLPTGAATEATLASIDGKLNSLGQKAMAASVPVVIASDQSNVNVVVASALPAGSALIGKVDVNLDVVDFLDTPVLDASSTNVPASASSPLEVVASLAANVKKIRVSDTAGEFIGIYTGSAASEVLQCIAGPGIDGDIEVQMSSAQRVSLRNMANAAITSGKFCVQFYG